MSSNDAHCDDLIVRDYQTVSCTMSRQLNGTPYQPRVHQKREKFESSAQKSKSAALSIVPSSKLVRLPQQVMTASGLKGLQRFQVPHPLVDRNTP